MATQDRPEREEVVVPLTEEVAQVHRRMVETGRVRVALSTEAETRLLRETLHGRRAEVERVPVGRTVETVPAMREEPDGVLVIPVLEEELIVERRLVLREEIRIRLVDTEEAVELPVELRRQRAEVERLPPDPPAAAAVGTTPTKRGGTP